MAILLPSTLYSFPILSAGLLLLLLSQTAMANNALFSDSESMSILWPGQNLTNNLFSLAMQRDCDLVLYENGRTIKWQSNTTVLPAGSGDCFARIDNNGVFTIHNGPSVLATFGTAGARGRYALLVVTHGGIRIYGPTIWSNYENNYNIADEPDLYSSEQSSDYFIYSRQTLLPVSNLPNTLLVNGEYSLVMKTDCNLAVINRGDGRVRWETHSNRVVEGKCTMYLRPDGELFVADSVGPDSYPLVYRIWSSGVSSITHIYICALRTSGELAIYIIKEMIYGGHMDVGEKMKLIKMVA